jgi:hypothetical protein
MQHQLRHAFAKYQIIQVGNEELKGAEVVGYV